MKVAVFMPIWGRHEILQMALKGFREMRERWAKEGFYVKLCIGWSDPADMNAVLSCYGYPDVGVFAVNSPLSDKHNKLAVAALSIEPDYFFQLGSDDVLLPKGDEVYFQAMHNGCHNAGLLSMYFAHPPTKEAVKITYAPTSANKIWGAGRLLSREAVEAAFDGGELWNKEADRSLDWISENRLIDLGYPPQVLTDVPCVVDVKSDTNIQGWSRFANGAKVDFSELVRQMPCDLPYL